MSRSGYVLDVLSIKVVQLCGLPRYLPYLMVGAGTAGKGRINPA